MHRAALKHRGIVAAGKANGVIDGWSVLSRRRAQRALSNGPGSAGGRGEDSTQDKGRASRDGRATRGQRGVGDTGPGGMAPAGRGRGAFTQFLRTHEQTISENIKNIDKRGTDSRRGRRGQAVKGQFDDPEDAAAKKLFAGTAREKDSRGQRRNGDDSSRAEDDWQEEWFSHEDARIDALGNDEEDEQGDMPELDDDEEDDHFDPNDEYDSDVWVGYSQEQIKQFKIMGARLEQEEADQMASLRAKWEKTKADSEKEHGTAKHLELPDIIITHEITYNAPPGKANADRAMPLPRPLNTIVDSMELPAGLDVTPDDPEYEQVVNMWMSVSRNNTMDEKMKKSVIAQISTFIAKHRDSDAFQKALQMQDFPERGGR